MLFRSELKKTLLTHRGILILAVCLLVKCLVLFWFPEQKDNRIVLSQKQYDKFLVQLHGPATDEKNEWILSEYAHYKDIIGQQEAMRKAYAAGELTEAQWEAYTEELRIAELRSNSAKIFAEKAEQFLAQPDSLPPAHYIYEYGWQTVFTLLQFPDIFLLFGLVLLSAQSFSAEAAGGMLPILLAAKDGRKQLFRAKLGALLAIAFLAFLLFAGTEVWIFRFRGWCYDAWAPLYSVSIVTDAHLDLTLAQGYGLCLAIRLGATLLLTAMLFSLSLWVRSSTNLIFSGLCLILLPLLWDYPITLNTHGGLLAGTKALLWLGDSLGNLTLPGAVVAGYSLVILRLAEGRHRRGL